MSAQMISGLGPRLHEAKADNSFWEIQRELWDYLTCLPDSSRPFVFFFVREEMLSAFPMKETTLARNV